MNLKLEDALRARRSVKFVFDSSPIGSPPPEREPYYIRRNRMKYEWQEKRREHYRKLAEEYDRKHGGDRAMRIYYSEVLKILEEGL